MGVFRLYKFDENGEICFSNFQITLYLLTALVFLQVLYNSFFPFNTNPITQAWNIINITVDVKEQSAITPDLCLISVDSTSTKNKVVWESPLRALDSFMIYREFARVTMEL